MTFKEYQEQSRKTAIYPNVGSNFIYPTLGLASEAGEVAGKIKKIFRDGNGVIDAERKRAILKEIGDVLWYVSQLSVELGFDLEEVAEANIQNLSGRDIRGTLHGDGDNR